MATRTRVVLLTHPKEFKQEKAATGRLTHLCLSNSEIVMGIGFDENARVRDLLTDATKFPVLLYQGATALNLSVGGAPALQRAASGKELVVFVLDGTWALARKMLKLSPALQALPRVMFTPSSPSRYRIKQQPVEGCLSTLEAVHELLTVLEATGLDDYANPDQLLSLFERMQQFQIECARDPARNGYRRAAYQTPEERKPLTGRTGRRRMRVFRTA